MYEDDLAYIHAAGFSAYAQGAAVEIVRRLKAASLTVEHVVDAGDDGDTDAFIGAGCGRWLLRQRPRARAAEAMS
jgi:hypothetical protein